MRTKEKKQMSYSSGKYRQILNILIILMTPAILFSQGDTTQSTLSFELGEVQVTSSRKVLPTHEVNLEEIQQFNRNDAAAALQLVPGLTYLNSGPRNESVVNVRGFDLRQVPVYLDGIPVCVTYDGYADLGNFLVQDMAKVTVSKGVSSVLFGPNTLGGAINLVTRKPEKKLEMEGSTGLFTGPDGYNGWHSDIHAGTRFEKFYVQAGYSITDRDSYSLSSKYPSASSGNDRVLDNSFRRDMKWNIKTGITPNKTDEYALSYWHQNGYKGIPVYAGADPGQPVRYWQFPEVYNRGIHLISKTAMGPAGFLKTRFYYDQYYSELRSYDSTDYSSQTKRTSFTSIYADESFGGSAEYHLDYSGKHSLKAAVHYKNDHHREHNIWPVNEKERHMQDHFISAGIEENYSPSQNLIFTGGVSYNFRDNIRADQYDARNDSVFSFIANRDAALNAQIGMEYHIAKNQEVRVSLARKNRFATMKDRYSYRLGRSLPNPDLTSESAFHIDLGYSARVQDLLQTDVSLFTSLLNHTIQPVYGIDPENSSIYQMQNTGRAVFYGLETGFTITPFRSMQVGFQYTFLERKNLSHPDIFFTDVPRHKIFGYMKYGKEGKFYILIDSGYNSERPSTSNGEYVAPGFFIADLKVSVQIIRAMAVEVFIENILDADYSYYEGYPEEGRNFYVSLKYLLIKE